MYSRFLSLPRFCFAVALLASLLTGSGASAQTPPDSAAAAGGAASWPQKTALPTTGNGKVVIGTLAVQPRDLSFMTSPDGHTVARWVSSGADIKGYCQLTTQDGSGDFTWPVGGPISAIAFSADSAHIALSVGDDQSRNTVQVWDVSSHKLLRTFNYGGNAAFSTVAFSPSGKSVAAAYNQKEGRSPSQVILWDVATGKVQRVLQTGKFNAPATSLAFSPDDKLLAVATNEAEAGNGEIDIWNLWQGKIQSVTITGGVENAVNKLLFSPNSKLLASAGDGIALRDAVSGKLQRLLPLHARAKSIAFLQGGKTLIASDTYIGKVKGMLIVNPIVKTWDLSSGSVRGHAAVPTTSTTMFTSQYLTVQDKQGNLQVLSLKGADPAAAMQNLKP